MTSRTPGLAAPSRGTLVGVHAARRRGGVLAGAIAATLFANVAVAATVQPPVSPPINISPTPLFVGTATKPNVLFTIANSQSMDEDATGLAVGATNANSRSEIARRVTRNLIANYANAMNVGLMAFQQNAQSLWNLHSSPYDVSYDPADYDPAYVGPREGQTKKFREPNPSDAGNFVYFNVNLPYYNAGNDGNGFCYSSTANAFNNGEVVSPMIGPWDSYRCFRVKTGTSNFLPTNGGQEIANGWSTYFATYTFQPTDSDLGQGITDFGRFLTWRWVSQAWFNNGSPGGGYLHVPVAPVDAAQTTRLNTKLATSQFALNRPTDPNFPLQNAGLTPLEGTLYTIRDYFAGTLNDAARGGPRPAPPNSCGKDFSVIMTNGLPSVTRTGTPSANTVQMLTDASTAAAAVQAQGVLNYIVGFALPFGVNPTQLDTIAAAGGTGTSLYATDEATLYSTLNYVFADILIRSGAAGAVALNSGSIQTNSRVYQARFNTGNWTGQLQAFPIQADGSLGAALWDANTVLTSMDWSGTGPTSRVILTYRRSGNRGIPFRWPANPASPAADELTVPMSTALDTAPNGANDGRGQLRLDYLRGDGSNEGTGALQFRPRPAGRLGDVVNSSPVYVGRPALNSSDPAYQAFKAANAGRPAMIYVGGNDGMLHGFDAATGKELLAYVPRAVYPKLRFLTGLGYAHDYFVDGSPTASDVDVNGLGWRTILAGGLGAGGRAVFALDVTDPGSFTEANAAAIVRWEYSDQDDDDVGYTYGTPTVTRLNNGRAAVIFGNGYNNTGSGKAALFVVDLQTRNLIRKITVGSGSPAAPNGLSTPAVVDLDGNGTADFVYAGDLHGNVWKFDLSASNSGSWSAPFGNATPLFVATDGAGNRQAITTALEITRHPTAGVMVLFGTGRYVDVGDPLTSQTQSLYGIRDNGAPLGPRWTTLVQQTVADTATVSSVGYRAVSSNPVDYAVADGWFMDLPDTGERVAVDPILRYKRFIVPTLVPNTAPCAAGGTGWLMELDYLTGGELPRPPFDVDNDGRITNSDQVAFGVGTRAPGGQRLDAISSSPAVVRGFGVGGGIENKYLNQSTGSIARVAEAGEPLANRRTSWRESKTD